MSREGGSRKGVSEDIKMIKLKKYSEGLLGGEKRRIGLKRNKATGVNGMENKALRFGGKGVKKDMWNMCSKVWRGAE